MTAHVERARQERRALGRGELWLASSLALLGLGCSDEPLADGEPLGVLGDAIVNGSVDNGDPAVVSLTAFGQAFCTGTLIRSNIVLTAAHCLPPNLSSFGISSYQQIDVFFGTYVGNGTFIPVSTGWTNPQWNDQEILYDIGLVRLSQNAPTSPIPFRENPMTPLADEGDPARIVGFGITSEGAQGSSGTKRVANTTVDEVYQGVFIMNFTPSGTCSGDSGGPTLMNTGQGEVVAGVHSRSDCVAQSIDTRVDEYTSDIYAFIGENPPPSCSSDGQCAAGCTAVDPDCPCAGDGFCNGSCPNPADDPDCAAPTCVADGTCDAGCTDDPDCPPPEACTGDGTCNEACADDPDCTTVVAGSCSQDGVCEAGCETPDPDCWGSGTQPVDYDGTLLSAGGCHAAPGAPPRSEWLWVGLASLVIGSRRRRRRRA